tara:strand:- start:85 stop:270 length:186 start_codon:yes stop_codon:yes gene_type:complete
MITIQPMGVEDVVLGLSMFGILWLHAKDTKNGANRNWATLKMVATTENIISAALLEGVRYR